MLASPLIAFNAAAQAAPAAVPVPEAGSFLLLATGLLALGGVALGYKYFCTYDHIPAGLERKTAKTEILSQEMLRAIVSIERRRARRSKRPSMLMILSCADPGKEERTQSRVLRQAAPSIVTVTRETDLVGWHENGRSLGVILTDMRADDLASAQRLGARVFAALHEKLGATLAATIAISLRALDSVPGAPAQDLVVSRNGLHTPGAGKQPRAFQQAEHWGA